MIRYDHDIRIHLLARGPGITPGSLFAFPGTQVSVPAACRYSYATSI